MSNARKLETIPVLAMPMDPLNLSTQVSEHKETKKISLSNGD